MVAIQCLHGYICQSTKKSEDKNIIVHKYRFC